MTGNRDFGASSAGSQLGPSGSPESGSFSPTRATRSETGPQASKNQPRGWVVRSQFTPGSEGRCDDRQNAAIPLASRPRAGKFLCPPSHIGRPR